MDLPERFSNLPAYAFPRLRALLDSHPGCPRASWRVLVCAGAKCCDVLVLTCRLRSYCCSPILYVVHYYSYVVTLSLLLRWGGSGWRIGITCVACSHLLVEEQSTTFVELLCCLTRRVGDVVLVMLRCVLG